MIKRTLEVSSGPAFLYIQDDQLIIQREGREAGRAPCEDVGMLLVDQQAVTYTHSVLTRLMQYGAAVVLCGPDHLPCGLVLPMEGNELLTQRLHVQMEASEPLRKRLWAQVVRAKILAQAENLAAESAARRRLEALAREVKSGDGENAEGQAARIYWEALLGTGFRRARGGAWPNPLLNYGYMVMRAAVARALASAGLHPSLGLHHHHRGNAFCLADDLVEPLRPLVDRAVLGLLETGAAERLTPEVKRVLLGLLTVEVQVGEQRGPLMVQLHRVAAGLWRCYVEGHAGAALELPRAVAGG